jgi:hypothetical protein
VLEQQAHMPGLFLKGIAIAEILGALGLVLPGLFKIRQELTPIAAIGLFIIMIGATITTLLTMDAGMAALPAATGMLTAFVAYGRRQAVSRSSN